MSNTAPIKIAAFDLGSTAAIACNCTIRAGKLKDSGAWYQHYGLEDKNATRPQRLAHFLIQTNIYILRARPEVVVFERPFARGQAATRALWGYAGILDALAINHNLIVTDFTPAEIKKWSTGNGRASKDEMLVAAWRLGYEGDNEHEADAFLLLKFSEAGMKRSN